MNAFTKSLDEKFMNTPPRSAARKRIVKIPILNRFRFTFFVEINSITPNPERTALAI